MKSILSNFTPVSTILSSSFKLSTSYWGLKTAFVCFLLLTSIIINGQNQESVDLKVQSSYFQIGETGQVSGMAIQFKISQNISSHWNIGMGSGMRFLQYQATVSPFPQIFVGLSAERYFEADKYKHLYLLSDIGYAAILFPTFLFSEDIFQLYYNDFYSSLGIGWEFDSGWFLESSFNYSPFIKSSILSFSVGYCFEDYSPPTQQNRYRYY